MEKIIFKKEGKSKEELIKCLEQLEAKHAKEISEYNISVKRDNDKIYVSGSRNILFFNFWVNAVLTAEDNMIILEFETNAPKKYFGEAENLFRKLIDDTCL